MLKAPFLPPHQRDFREADKREAEEAEGKGEGKESKKKNKGKMQRQHAVHMLRYHKVTMTGRMRKSAAFATLVCFYAARTVQRWFRRVTQLNDACPISLEPVAHPCVSIRTSRCGYVRYNMAAFHEFLSSTTCAVVREPTTNRPITPRTMRVIARKMTSLGFATATPRARVGALSMVDCLENVVDALMSEVLDEEAYLADDALEEWHRNVERALGAIAVHSRGSARLKARQCVASCTCTAACATRDAELPCPHPACLAALRQLLLALSRPGAEPP
jgi:hypothetical protein